MPEAHSRHIHYFYQKLPLAQVAEVPPILNTWYDILAVTEDVELIYVVGYQTNDEAAAKDIEIRAIIDGITHLGTISAPSGTAEYSRLGATADNLVLGAIIVNVGQYVPLKGLSVQTQIRITQALGTNQTLRGYTQYHRHVET